jgi:LPXTG-site transpeptidase (sortase) family protein
MSARSVARAFELLLLAIAVVCLSWYGWRMYEIAREEERLNAEVSRALADVKPPPRVRGRGRGRGQAEGRPANGIIGKLEIPRLNLSAPIQTGDDESVLDASVGYLPDTPLPWMSGNSALASHRDRLFRPLRFIRKGDTITLSTTHGVLNYRVLKTMIVNPGDVWVLKPLPKVNLTLITCYPFYFVGHAPRRFIVQAEKVRT